MVFCFVFLVFFVCAGARPSQAKASDRWSFCRKYGRYNVESIYLSTTAVVVHGNCARNRSQLNMYDVDGRDMILTLILMTLVDPSPITHELRC